MVEINVKTLTIEEAHKGLVGGDFSVAELVGAYRKKIDELNPELNAYLEIYSDIDEQVKMGYLLLLKIIF